MASARRGPNAPVELTEEERRFREEQRSKKEERDKQHWAEEERLAV